MKRSSKILSIVAALALALVLGACAAPRGQGASTGGSQPTGIEELAKASGAAVTFDESFTEAEVTVEVADGESLVILSKFEDEDLSQEVTATTYQNGEEAFTDYSYGGYGYSATGVDPGTYEVKIDAGGAKGTMWVLSYSEEGIDVMEMEAEEIVNQVLADVA